MAAKTAAKADKGGAAKHEPVASRDGRVFRVIRGASCSFCGGYTYLATMGPKRPAVRVCDSKWIADDLRAKIKASEAEIKRIFREQDDVVLRQLELEELVVLNDAANLKKFLGLKPKAMNEEIEGALAKARTEIAKTIVEKAKASEEIPEKEKEMRRLSDRLARTIEFCLAIMGWRDNRVIRFPQEASPVVA